jgi:uncharacterized lipoprotein YmbA
MTYVPWWIVPSLAMLAGCAANPEQSVYVMSQPTSLPAGLPIAAGRLALTVRPVILPDYLDTTDLLTRSGQHGIEASRTGRWGERLSKGVTRSLAADLAHRLHADIVADGPAIEIQVRISAFDVTSTCSVLAAGWRIVWPGKGRAPVSQHGVFSVRVAQPGGDLAMVTAMTETIKQLSDAIVAPASQEVLF